MIPTKSFTFGPLLMQTHVELDLLSELKNIGDQAREKKLYFNRALAGHIENQYHFDDGQTYWFYNRFEEYFNVYLQMFQSHMKTNDSIRFQPMRTWINYMKNGEFNPPHVHSADLSFVIFVDVPDELFDEKNEHVADSPPPGSISFIHGEDSDWSISGHSHFPKTGEMFIFPAKLRHFVFPFKSDIERISVSGNLRMINDSIQKN